LWWLCRASHRAASSLNACCEDPIQPGAASARGGAPVTFLAAKPLVDEFDSLVTLSLS
jgi:hypothetical protein